LGKEGCIKLQDIKLKHNHDTSKVKLNVKVLSSEHEFNRQLFILPRIPSHKSKKREESRYASISFYDIRLYQVSLESYHMRHPMEYKYNLRKAHAIIGITKTSDRKEAKSKWQLKGS
jgi:hypothetical protein